MTYRTTFTRKESGSIVIPQPEVDAYTKKVNAWLEERGIPVSSTLQDDTPTLCSQSTASNTNTRDNDDHIDNIQDQITDDSRD